MVVVRRYRSFITQNRASALLTSPPRHLYTPVSNDDNGQLATSEVVDVTSPGEPQDTIISLLSTVGGLTICLFRNFIVFCIRPLLLLLVFLRLARLW